MAKSSISMKLLIDTQGQRVLFAEASKDGIDFLFHILSLPVATVISLLKNQGMVGSVANLYESLENLNDSYMQPNQSKNALLKPVNVAASVASFPLLLLKNAPSSEKKYYTCDSRPASGYLYNYQYHYTVSDDPRAVCPNCSRAMTIDMMYVAPPDAVQKATSPEEGGIVRGLVTYMVMDNLVVKPMSTISSITLLNKFNVKEVGKLEEKVVDLGMPEAVNLLKASLQSERVLTDVFLKGKVLAAGRKS